MQMPAQSEEFERAKASKLYHNANYMHVCIVTHDYQTIAETYLESEGCNAVR